MSVPNGDRTVTKQDLADFYNDIRPYMGGIVTPKAGFTPIGTIISVMGTTAPVNYLACDGTVYNIADYVELANYFNEQFGSKNFFGGNGTTTFAVPDLRGEFLRGTGTNSHANQGSGANVGVHQDATKIPTMSSGDGMIGISNENANNLDYFKSVSNTPKWYYVNSSGNNSGDATYYGQIFTSRPTNTSVLYCIATKNFYIDPTLDYSLDEKVVGTWIDGKPIYQKTVNVGSVSAGTTKAVDLNGIDMVCAFSGVAHSLAYNQQIPIVFGHQNMSNYVVNVLYTENNNKINVYTGDDFALDWCFITLQYIKTAT